MTGPVSSAPMPPLEQPDQQASEDKAQPARTLDQVLAEEVSTPIRLEHSPVPFQSSPYQPHTFHQYRHSTSTSSTTSSPSTATSYLGPASSFGTPGTSPDTPASSGSYSGPFHSSARSGSDSKSDPRWGSMSNTAKKLKNPKNLALNNLTSSNTGALSSPPLSANSQAGFESPALYSPSFVKPAGPRRKSTALGLTLQTPSSDTFAAPDRLSHVPPTPGGGIKAGTFPPQGLNYSNSEARPIAQFTSNLTTFPVDETDQLREPEGKQQGVDGAYPNGPICIYEPYVDLYFEPTAEEAAQYDVIVNVASEVRNPFLKDADASFSVTDIKAAVDELSSDRSFSATPTDSKRQSSSDAKLSNLRTTEYIHIPWEHNSNMILGTAEIPTLHDIVKIVDDRVSSNKKVLIHCQCGVSRSASLIVAYGLFKNTNATVQEAYDMVKQKSKWIGPNMSLIMQLQEYRTDLQKFQAANRGSLSKTNSKVLHGRRDMNDPFAPETAVPQTAPLPQDGSPSKSKPSPIELESMPVVSAGPSSAPSELRWPSISEVKDRDGRVRSPSSASTTETIVGPSKEADAKLRSSSVASGTSGGDASAKASKRAGSVGSLLIPPLSLQSSQPLESPRSSEFAMSPFRPVDDDPTFGLTSPRDRTFGSFSSGVSPMSKSPFSSTSPFGTSPLNATSFSTSPERNLPLAPLIPPEDDVTLGLTSPRAATFGSLTGTRAFPSQPLMENDPINARARADLQAQLGFSNHASSHGPVGKHPDVRNSPVRPISPTMAAVAPPTQNETSHDEALMSPRATELTNNPFHDALSAPPLSPLVAVAPPTTEEPDFAEALMSPRATEFANNPFHDALSTPASATTARLSPAHNSPGAASSASEDDPRSPPLQGLSPINRNILDVLDSSS